MPARPRLVRRPDEGMIAGVAAGIAESYDIDVTWVRIGLVGLAVVIPPLSIAYLFAAVIMPRAEDQEPGLASARRNVDDLVGKGREFYGESKRVVEKVRGREVGARTGGEGDRGPVAGEHPERRFKPGESNASKDNNDPFATIDGASGI